jgi:predicted negative regulator of RcsB-dependent stress response
MYSIAIAISAVLSSAPATQAGEEFEAFARGVERGIAEGRADALTLDIDSLAQRVTADIPAPEKFRTGFVNGMKSSGVDRSLSKQLAESARAGGSTRLLRVRPTKGGARALYRVLNANGVNYLDLHLERQGTAKIKIVDSDVFILGETLSESMRRLYLLALSDAKLGVLDQLMGKEREFLKNAHVLKEIQRLQQEKKHAEVIAAFEKLPASLRKERVFLLARLNAASALGDEKQYRRAIEDYEAALPGDPSLDLVSIDGHFLRKQYDQALARVDRLDSRVKDPYLEFMRGSILLEKGDREGAKRRFRAAIAGEPTLQPPYWAIIAVVMKEKDFKSTAELLTSVEKDAGVELADLEEVPEFAEFVKSKEYRAWKKRRQAR